MEHEEQGEFAEDVVCNTDIEMTPVPEYRLFSVPAMVAGSLLGGFLGAGIVMSLNYRRLGEKKLANTCLITFGLIHMIFLGYVYLTMDGNPTVMYGTLATVVTAVLGWQFLGQTYRERDS